MSDRMSEDDLLQLINKLNITNNAQDIASDKESKTEPSLKKDGVIHIANNKIMVQDPADDGSPATIEFDHPIKLRVNGAFVKNKTSLRSEDKIEWSVEEPPLYNIEISPDNMKVLFHIKSKQRYDWKLKNVEASIHITLEVEEDKSIVLETISLTDVMNTLNKMNISRNTKPPSIYKELQNPTFDPVLVAHGIPPTESIDASLELFFNENVESAFQEIGGSVDFDYRVIG